jgi:hypothetical protein
MDEQRSLRFNDGKLRWDLVDWTSLEEMVKVLEAGAIKYAPDNWKKGLHREETLESLQRHLIALFKKEELDPDLTTLTGQDIHHMGNIMCNAMFYLYHHRNNSFTKERNNPFKNEKRS